MSVSGKSNTTDNNNNNNNSKSISDKLGSKTTFLNLRLYVVIAVVAAVCVISLCLFIFFYVRSKRRSKMGAKQASSLIPVVSKEIVEIKALDREVNNPKGEVKIGKENFVKEEEEEKALVVEVEKNKKSGSSSTVGSDDLSGGGGPSSDVSADSGWGRWYSLKELEIATRGFAEENIVGEGGYGVVYRGVLPDASMVAVKDLHNNKGQAQKEFKVEVEAIGKVRHKNLVGLIGYCVEGARRILVYEYVDYGNLGQWLHGDVGPVSPLTWDIRMKIAIGTAKGLAYLHEGLEPKVVHRDVKSSNILLDRKWNPKVSDFGLAKLLHSEESYVTTRVMGTFGYVSPDYASTGMLNEGCDVYSFGVLLMEIITGRIPIDYSRPAGETNLVDWFKGMVASRHGEDVVDRLIEVQPPSRALKRTLLVCLKCIDLDGSKRPKMGQIVHMLEADDFPFRAELRLAPSHGTISKKVPCSEKHDEGNDEERSRRRDCPV